MASKKRQTDRATMEQLVEQAARGEVPEGVRVDVEQPDRQLDERKSKIGSAGFIISS